MMEIQHVSLAKLEKGLNEIKRSPTNNGTVEMIVVRPAVDQRETPTECEVSPSRGVHGDRWEMGPQKVGTGNQITLMNARVIQLIATNRERWALAGDNLFVDLDLSQNNMPPGKRLTVGTALVEVTDVPHNGCKKFAQRFGVEAVKFISTPLAHELHLRGIHVRVITGGSISLGDVIRQVG